MMNRREAIGAGLALGMGLAIGGGEARAERPGPVQPPPGGAGGLAEFARQAWPVLNPTGTLLWNWHHEVICEHLEAVSDGRIRRLIINMPPGHLASTLVSVLWPAWEWIGRPDARLLTVSSDGLWARRDALGSRMLMDSRWYRERHRPDWEARPLCGDGGYKSNTRSGFRWSIGMRGPLVGWRVDRIVVDHPLDAKDRHNSRIKDGHEAFWVCGLSTRFDDPGASGFILVTPRMAKDDLSGRLLARGGFEHVRLPALIATSSMLGDAGEASRTSLGRYEARTRWGEVLHPGYCGLRDLRAIKDMIGMDAFMAMYQQDPHD